MDGEYIRKQAWLVWWELQKGTGKIRARERYWENRINGDFVSSPIMEKIPHIAILYTLEQ